MTTTVKEQLVELVRAEGYDFMRACVLVNQCLARFHASGKASETYTIGGTVFTLRQAEGDPS